MHCGAIGPVTADHVPPKGLFAPPRPNLVTVPSCEACNAGASLDDEYFRAMLCFHDTAGNHPDARKVRDGVFRGLARKERTGLRRKIAQATREVEVRTPSGLFAGKRLAFDVDLARLDRVVARTLRGLYFKEKGYRVPDGYVAEVNSIDGMAGMPPWDFAEVNRELIQPALARKPRVIGNDVLCYWMAPANDYPHVTGWVFRFYGRVEFVGTTLPRDEVHRARGERAPVTKG